MSAYGFEIVQTLIVDIEPDPHVKKILQIKKAEGESKYLSGLGIARQRQAIVDGLRDSMIAFSDNVLGTTAKDVMDMVLVLQYFDTMKEIGASTKPCLSHMAPVLSRTSRHRSGRGFCRPRAFVNELRSHWCRRR